jgi:hypothetical protein
MTDASTDVEQRARIFPSPENSRSARSLTYRSGGRIYSAVIGQARKQRDAAGVAPASGSTVLSIVATHSAVEIWCREPARDWPNPSLVSQDDILSIDYFDDQDPIGT